MIEHVLGLYEALRDEAAGAVATPEEGRRATGELRMEAARRGNYFVELEQAATKALSAVDYAGGPLAERDLRAIADHYGFTIHPVQEFPTAVRSVTDQDAGRIYIPQRDELRTRASRSVVLRTLGHFALGHRDPTSYAEFLRQRMEAA